MGFLAPPSAPRGTSTHRQSWALRQPQQNRPDVSVYTMVLCTQNQRQHGVLDPDWAIAEFLVRRTTCNDRLLERTRKTLDTLVLLVLNYYDYHYQLWATYRSTLCMNERPCRVCTVTLAASATLAVYYPRGNRSSPVPDPCGPAPSPHKLLPEHLLQIAGARPADRAGAAPERLEHRLGLRPSNVIVLLRLVVVVVVVVVVV